jgi:hypothetical protein
MYVLNFPHIVHVPYILSSMSLKIRPGQSLCKNVNDNVHTCFPPYPTNTYQANYINALTVSVLPFFEPAMPMTLGGLFVTLGGFWYDIG